MEARPVRRLLAPVQARDAGGLDWGWGAEGKTDGFQRQTVVSATVRIC